MAATAVDSTVRASQSGPRYNAMAGEECTYRQSPSAGALQGGQSESALPARDHDALGVGSQDKAGLPGSGRRFGLPQLDGLACERCLRAGGRIKSPDPAIDLARTFPPIDDGIGAVDLCGV